MTIGEAARRCGLSTYTIRYYEDEGVLAAPQRLASGRRHYEEENVRMLRCVAALRRAGMPVADMRALVRELQTVFNDKERAPDPGSLNRSIALLRAHKKRLDDDAAEIGMLQKITEAALETLVKTECGTNA